MRLKYYLRGIGAGILLATILLSFNFYFGGSYNNNEISDDEIIARAEELGMVMEENESQTEQEDDSVQENDDSSVEEQEPVASESEKSDEEMTLEEFVEEAENNNAESENEIISYQAFTVSSGQSSETIASNLYSQGLISDSDDFNKYLNKLGVDDRIQSGTFYVQVGSSYDDIVALLVNKEVRTTTPPEN